MCVLILEVSSIVRYYQSSHFSICFIKGEVQEDLVLFCPGSSPLQWLLQFIVTLENPMNIHDRQRKG